MSKTDKKSNFEKFITDALYYAPVISLRLEKNDNIEKLELSLINLILFGFRLSVFNFWGLPTKAKWQYFVRFERVIDSKIETEENISKKVEQYKNHLLYTPDSQKIEKEALNYHINLQRNRVSTADLKASIFTTLVIAIIPLLTSNNNFVGVLGYGKIGKIILSFFIYFLFNAFFFLFSFYYTKSVWHSSFADLKDSNNKFILQNTQLYYDWQRLIEYADNKVSTVSVIINHILYIVFFYVIICVFNFLPFFGEKRTQINVNHTNSIITLNYENLRIRNSTEYIKFEQILINLRIKNISDIIIVYGDCNVEFLKTPLEKNKSKDINIIYIYDKNISSDIIKIIFKVKTLNKLIEYVLES